MQENPKESPPTRTVTANGRWVKTIYDGLGRTIKAETGYGTTTVSIVDTEYDSCACSPLGKLKRVSQPYAPGGTVYWTTYSYDGLGRTVSVALPNASGTTTYLYEGNTVKTTDPAGKWKKFTSDAVGNLVTVNEPNPAGGADYVTTYSYNVHNQLTQVSMPRPTGTQTRTFNYDLATGRLMSATNPENGTVNYGYNADGTTAWKTDAKNQRIEYIYDSYKRVTKVRRYPVNGGNEDPCQQVDFYYDSNPFDGSFSQNAAGRLAATRWGVAETYTINCITSSGAQTWNRPGEFIQMYSYTPGGAVTKNRLRLNRNTPPAATADLDASYTYDNEGQMVSSTYPSAYKLNPVSGTWVWTPGATYTYAFDSMGRPNKLTDNQPSPLDWTKDVLYGTAGELTQMKTYHSFNLANGFNEWATETRTYNARLQLTQLSRIADFSGSLGTMQYVYPAANNGRISQMVASGETVNYTYDSLNRLIAAATPGNEPADWGLSFSYDGFGNRLSQLVTKGSAPTQTIIVKPQYNQVDGLTYDANGNQTTLNGVSMAYDVDNRLMTYGSNDEQYAYAPDNQRVWKKRSDGSEEVYFYSVSGQRLGIYQVYAPNGTVLQFRQKETRIYFGGRPLSMSKPR